MNTNKWTCPVQVKNDSLRLLLDKWGNSHDSGNRLLAECFVSHLKRGVPEETIVVKAKHILDRTICLMSEHKTMQ